MACTDSFNYCKAKIMPSIDQLRSSHTMTTNRSQTRNDSPAAKESTSQDSKVSQDAVSLSQQSKALGQLQQQMAAEPAFDAAKVASIKEAIANGSYTVDAEQLASNMLKFENEFAEL